jgi:hypothetical protein
VVADAVTYEPVSPANSLVTGKNTGKISVSARSAEPERKFAGQNQILTAEFPVNRNREFDKTLQGIERPNREFARD